jgi:gluconolactonase
MIAEGLGFTEGPVITRRGEIVVTSIDQGRVYRLTHDGGELLADVGGGANGATEGTDGTVYVAQNGGQWAKFRPRPGSGATGGIQAVGADSTVEWVTRDPIAPNDLCFGPDGYLYFTDPTRRRRDDGRIWRCDTSARQADLLVSVHWFPNGIAFGPEDDALYVASSGDQRIIRFTLDNGRLSDPEVVIQMARGHPDGFAFDTEGNLVIAAVSHDEAPGEIQTWSLDGRLLDTFNPGDSPIYTNVALSADRELIITDASGGRVLIADNWPTAGLALHPFRS